MSETRQRPTLAEELLPLYRGIVQSEGCRRLSVALGGLFAVVLAVTVLIITDGNPAWDRFALIVAGAFLIPWALTQIVGWVIEGFRR